MALVGEADVPVGGLVGGFLRKGDVGPGLEANADQIGSEGLRQIEVRRDVPKATRPFVPVFGNGKVARYHGHSEAFPPQKRAGGFHGFRRAPDADNRSPHAQRGKSGPSCDGRERGQRYVHDAFVAEAFCNPYGKREFHWMILSEEYRCNLSASSVHVNSGLMECLIC